MPRRDCKQLSKEDEKNVFDKEKSSKKVPGNINPGGHRGGAWSRLDSQVTRYKVY
jgi:hypothetical protein